MADLQLETSANELKRPRDGDETLSESNQEAASTPTLDGIATPAKKLRADDTLDATNIEKANEVAAVVEEGGDLDLQDGDDEAKENAEVTKEVGEGDVLNEERALDDIGAKLLNGQTEHTPIAGGGAEDGGDLAKNGKVVEQEDGTKEQAKEVKLSAKYAGGLDEDGESVKPEDRVEAHGKEVKLGPKVFTSSLDMFNYFYDLLRGWPINFNVNKYEHMMLEDLIKKGHQDAERKIGAGIEAFQIRINPEFYSRCYYVIQKDGPIEDFSYRKCVDTLMPLPDNMKSPSGDLNKDRKGQGGHHHENRGRGGRFGSGGGNHGRGNRRHGGRKRFK